MKKLNDILKALCRPITITPQITATKGSVTQSYLRKVGRVCHLMIVVKNTAAISVGANVFEGNLANARPIVMIDGCGYYGSSAVILQLSSNGGMVARVIGSNLAANAEVYVSMIYICE